MLCSLTLTAIWGCSKPGKKNVGGEGATFEEITLEKLDELKMSSPKPFILVNFYATWCGPCRKELPGLVALENDPSGDIKVVLISIDEPEIVENDLAGFLEQHEVNFKTWVKTRDSDTFVRNLMTGWTGNIPLTLIYSSKGQLIEAIVGLTNENEIRMVIDRFKMMNDV